MNHPTAKNQGLQGGGANSLQGPSFLQACLSWGWGGSAVLHQELAFPASSAEQCLVVHTLCILSPGLHPTGLSISGRWAHGAAAVLVPSFLPGPMGSGDLSKSPGSGQSVVQDVSPCPQTSTCC